jgi:hypothetical protein
MIKMIKLSTLLLTELSEPKIKSTIVRWQSENPKVDEEAARDLIKQFEEVQSGLESKLAILVLPDELKKNNRYKSIDSYSYEDMEKMLRSIPENPEKVKKDAVKKFEKEGIPKQTAQSYAARFMANRDRLKYAVQNGTEDGLLTKEQVLDFIPNYLKGNNRFLTPKNWKWQDFEHILDALFPSQRKVSDDEINTVSYDGDKVYDDGVIEIYKGDDVNKCISYNPVIATTKRKKYSWCVTQVGNTNYDYYRGISRTLSGGPGATPTFYFVFDRSKSSEPEHYPFNDPWHAFVVQVTADETTYIVTDANNLGDKPANGWEDISRLVPSDTWDKIKNLKDYFKPIALSAIERSKKLTGGVILSLDEFKALDQDEKIMYVQAKASKNELKQTPGLLKILPAYKIKLQGRTTTLANIAIDSGQEFSYDDLKNYQQLAERYAIFRFRHTDYSKNPIPLSFIKYLDEPAKKTYLSKFGKENLTFEYVEKYFGEQATKDYVKNSLKTLDYLPSSATKYISNDEVKKLFLLYSKLFENWQYDAGTNVNEEEINRKSVMPRAAVDPNPVTLEQWRNLSSSDRNNLVKLILQLKNNEKYSTVLIGSPYIIKSGSTVYLLLPQNKLPEDIKLPSSDKTSITWKWVITDVNGKILKSDIDDSTSYIGENSLLSAYPDSDSKRVYDINDVIINDEPLSSNLKESIDWDKRKLLHRAGIIK